jgi:DUF1680 family protein
MPFATGEVKLRVDTDYPWNGRVNLRCETSAPVPFALHLRKPGWCTKADVKLNGVPSAAKPDDSGFWTLDREWRNGDSVELVLSMPLQVMVAHPNIASCRGKVALQRGPLVYGFEELDNGGNPRITLGVDPKFTIERQPDLLGGVSVIRGTAANGRPIQATPFCALANRGRSAQEVWVEQEGWKSGEGWWLGALYRPLPQK